jgi:hypothetical protein
MKAYSEDLRREIIEAIERGACKAEATTTLALAPPRACTTLERPRRGCLGSEKGIWTPPKIDETAAKLLEEDVEERISLSTACTEYQFNC